MKATTTKRTTRTIVIVLEPDDDDDGELNTVGGEGDCGSGDGLGVAVNEFICG